MTAQSYPEAQRADEISPELVPWEVRITWAATLEGVSCPQWSHYDVMGENAALDRAVSILAGCRHPDAPVKAVRAEIRRTKTGDPWRPIAGSASTYRHKP